MRAVRLFLQAIFTVLVFQTLPGNHFRPSTPQTSSPAACSCPIHTRRVLCLRRMRECLTFPVAWARRPARQTYWWPRWPWPRCCSCPVRPCTPGAGSGSAPPRHSSADRQWRSEWRSKYQSESQSERVIEVTTGTNDRSADRDGKA